MLSIASAPQSLQSPAATPSCTHHANSQISTVHMCSQTVEPGPEINGACMHPVEHIGRVHGLARCIEFGFDALAAKTSICCH